MPSRVLVAVAVALLSSACQSTMSIDEARLVTADFAGRSFVPPPRTVAEVTAILEQDRGVDLVAHARTLVDQPPPDTTDRDRLADFYFQRGRAAGAVGRIPQWIDDLSRAAEYARRMDLRMDILNHLANAHWGGGNLRRAIDIRQQMAAMRGAGLEGWPIPNQAKLARLYVMTGDLKAAGAAMRESARVLEESKRWQGVDAYDIAFWHAAVAMARGSVLEARGRFDEAERFYRESIAELAADAKWSCENSRARWCTRHPYRDGQVAQPTQLALLLIRDGRLLEAESEARKALLEMMSKWGRNTTGTASIVRVLARAIAEQGRYAEAETLARASLDIYARLGAPSDSFLQAIARTELAAALAGQGRWQAALDEYASIRTALAGGPRDPEMIGLLDLTVREGEAIALLKTGQTDQAVAHLLALLERSRKTVGDAHTTTAEIRGLLAAGYAARGEHARALAGFVQATRVLLDRAQEADDEQTARPAGEQRLRLIFGSYVRLLTSIRGTADERPAGIDPVAEAFRLAEVARGMSVQHSLDAAAARAAAKTPALAELVRLEQDARKQISALYGLIAAALSVENTSSSVEDLRGQIAKLEQARQAIRQQIEREFPAYTQLINPRPLTLEQVRSRLRSGEALISTYVDDDRTFVWAVPPRGPVAFAVAPLGRRALDEIVGALRASLDPGAATLGDIPAFDVARAHRLYAALLEPVAEAWRGADTLLIVADGGLAQLPFGLLPTRAVALGAEHGALFAHYRQVPWLIRSHAITVLPSVTALATLRAVPPGDPDRRPFIGFGDPLFNREQAAEAARETAAVQQTVAVSAQEQRLALRASPKTQHLSSARLAMLPRLPETAEELRSMALAMHADVATDVVLGARANEATVKSLDLTRYRVLAFATHGLSPGELDGLTQPALALSAPDVAGVDGDGLLTMEKILALRLNADWIVLSACNTASGQGAGAEALSGLGRAFFYAGARALLVSNWPVETTSAGELTTELFRRQRDAPTLTRAKALQATMNALIDGPGFLDAQTQRVIFSYAHPIFWAPFTLIGDGSSDASAM